MRTYRPPTEARPQERAFGQPTAALDKFLAIYARQSTKEQVLNNREAYDQQTIGLVKQGKEMGWAEDIILVYIENKRKDGKWTAASGRLRIDQREGLQALTERIERDEVKTVLVWAVDRLFRDEDMIQPAVFAKLCKEHNCLVMTTDDIFDFNNRRRDDRKRFLDAAQAAADYVTKHVRGRMLPARDQLSLRGLADSRRISVGYIVADRHRYLTDGSENPNYKRLVVYEPHARVIRYLFRRFRELGGNLHALWVEIDAWPCVFPFFDDPQHAKYVGLSRNVKGYKITKTGLGLLLTNPIYIGWWYFRGEIVSKTTHDAIVTEDDFWYAFKRLSPITLEGEINRDRPLRFPTRYTHDGSPPPLALLDGIIAGEQLPIYVVRSQPPAYAITTRYGIGDHWKVAIGVSELDAIFVQRMLRVLEETEHGSVMRDHLNAIRSSRDQQLVTVDAQIAEVKEQIATWERSKRIAQEEKYEAGEREAVRELKSRTSILRQLELKQEAVAVEEVELLELVDLLFGAAVGWSELPFEKRRRFVRASMRAIILSQPSPHFLKLEIDWTGPDGRTDVGYIWRVFSDAGAYTAEEEAIIRALYPSADRAALLARLPNRSWTGIRAQARRLGVARDRFSENTSTLHLDVSMADHRICEMLGLGYEPGWSDKVTFWVTSSSNANSATSP